MAEVGQFSLRITVDPDTGKVTVLTDELKGLEAQTLQAAAAAKAMSSAYQPSGSNVMTGIFANQEEAAKGAAAATEKVGEAVKDANRTADAFQHAGIYLFSRQLLDMVGLGQLAQHAFMAINLSIEALADTIGVTSATLAPLLLAIGAGITIFAEFEHKTKDVTKALREQQKQLDEQAKGYKELLDQLKELESVMGTLPDDLKKLKDAQQSAYQEAQKTKAEAMGAELGNLQSLLVAEREKAETDREGAARLREVAAASKGLAVDAGAYIDKAIALERESKNLNDLMVQQRARVQDLQVGIKAVGEGALGTSDHIKTLTDQQKKHAEQLKKEQEAAEALAKSNAEVDAKLRAMRQRETMEQVEAFQRKLDMDKKEADAKKASAQQEELILNRMSEKRKELQAEEGKNSSNPFAARMAQVDQWAEHQRAAEDATYNAERQRLQKSNMDTEALARGHEAVMAQIDQTAASKRTQVLNEMAGVSGGAWRQMGEEAVTVSHQISQAMGAAFAKAIVEHKNMAEAMKAEWKNLAEQVISDLIRIAIEATIVKGLMAGIMGL